MDYVRHDLLNQKVCAVGRRSDARSIILRHSYPRSSGGSTHKVSVASHAYRLAARLDGVGFSDIVQIRNRIMELRAAGAIVYQFEGGEPFLNTPAHIKAAMRRARAADKTRYAPSSGVPELRAAIAAKVGERNGIPARMEAVLVVNGGMQGLFGAFQTVVN